MVAPLKLAITGGTGFVGSRLIDLALQSGHAVRALTRRPHSDRDGVEWIAGSLEDQAGLNRLAEGVDAVIHVAGVINAPDAPGFEAGNVAGTQRMLDAAKRVGVSRFVHVSSLAAREPGLSLYGASKARSEELVEAAPLSSAIVRPPAVYGPGDRETLELFRMANRGLVLLPPGGRLSVVHVDDLSRLLLALAAPATPGPALVEPDDAREGGWTHHEFGKALGRAVGRKVVTLSTPRAFLRAGAALDRMVRGERAKLTPDRVNYFCHPDWAVHPARGAPAELWTPQIDTQQGLADTARWYRQHGWL